ncbi:hypothetical protein L1887_32249 [Cichorium endivia]|nr:hypothetical protein L1887_32249 [Cichorium endivia]
MTTILLVQSKGVVGDPISSINHSVVLSPRVSVVIANGGGCSKSGGVFGLPLFSSTQKRDGSSGSNGGAGAGRSQRIEDSLVLQVGLRIVIYKLSSSYFIKSTFTSDSFSFHANHSRIQFPSPIASVRYCQLLRFIIANCFDSLSPIPAIRLHDHDEEDSID